MRSQYTRIKKIFPNIEDITKNSEKSYLKDKAILGNIIDNDIESYNYQIL